MLVFLFISAKNWENMLCVRVEEKGEKTGISDYMDRKCSDSMAHIFVAIPTKGSRRRCQPKIKYLGMYYVGCLFGKTLGSQVKNSI